MSMMSAIDYVIMEAIKNDDQATLDNLKVVWAGVVTDEVIAELRELVGA